MRDPIGLHPTGRLIIYRDDVEVAAVTSDQAAAAVLRLHGWPLRHFGSMYYSREGVPLSVASLSALVEKFEAAAAAYAR